MIRWIIIFLVIALIAAVLGFGGIAAGATEIAKIIFYIFLVLLAISVICTWLEKRRIKSRKKGRRFVCLFHFRTNNPSGFQAGV